MASEPQLPSADDILRMLMEAEANGGYGDELSSLAEVIVTP